MDNRKGIRELADTAAANADTDNVSASKTRLPSCLAL